MKKIGSEILTEEVRLLLEVQGEYVARNMIAKSDKASHKIRYSIADILVFFPSLSKRTLSDWCKKGHVGKKGINDNYYLTIEEVENYLFGKQK